MRMHTSTFLRALALTLQATLASGKVTCTDGKCRGPDSLTVAEITEFCRVDMDGQEVTLSDSGSTFEDLFRCVRGSGKNLMYSTDKKYVGCCLPGQHLAGSTSTAFGCCGADHDIVGDEGVGYRCCPTGQIFDGSICKPKPPPPGNQMPIVPGPGRDVCHNGKRLINGRCVCAPGTTENESGDCVKSGCTSGLESGRCYTFTDANGKRYGFQGSYYSAEDDSRSHIFGKFQLCKDADCTPGQPINPTDGFRIKDIHGRPNGGTDAKQWLNNLVNGGHIGKTPNFEQAGKFGLTKWPCGKYCWSGADAGLGPTCPSGAPAITFYTADTQACIPVDVMEVPCDVHAMENNCMWKSGDQCCNNVDCADAGKCCS